VGCVEMEEVGLGPVLPVGLGGSGWRAAPRALLSVRVAGHGRGAGGQAALMAGQKGGVLL